MTPLSFFTADVFTSTPFGGNPLAVIPEASGLDGGRMQQIAREFNLSETAFVLPPDDPRHTCRVRIFTPAAELPFAGHPTVGTALVLATAGLLALDGDVTQVVFEEGVGPVEVTIHARDGVPGSAYLKAAMLPEFGPPAPDPELLAAVLSLDVEALAGPSRPSGAVSCGVPFLFVPLRDREALARTRLDHGAWRAHLSGYWAPAVFPFCAAGAGEGADLSARMFAPHMGIEEDPATGAAAAALAGYLGRDAADGALGWTVAQGVDMGRPSILRVEAVRRAGVLRSVRVGGEAVLMSEGRLTLRDR